MSTEAAALGHPSGQPVTPTRIRTAVIGGFERITMNNGELQLVIMPEVGGKISSLINIASGREFLLQPPDRPVRLPEYGAAFEDYDTSGIDECFPTISDCHYPDGKFSGTYLPDHGEVWSATWQHEICGEAISLFVTGHRFPYVMRKVVSLENDTVLLRYELESTAKEPFSYIWSVHPLLNVHPGCRILLPPDVKETLVNWSLNDWVGKFGDSCKWPIAETSDGRKVDISVLGPRSKGTAQKLFTPRLSQGSCALYYPESEETIIFEFDPKLAPFLGVWICEGGWPNPERAHYTVALEPCSGRPDSLAEAMGRRECESIEPGQKKSWELRIRVGHGIPESLARRD